MEFVLKNGKKVSIRDVEVRDAKKLVEYMKIISAESKNLLRDPDEFAMTVEEEEKFIEKTISSEDNHMFTVWDGDLLISATGFHGSSLRRIKHKVSMGISILKDYNGLGLGSKLMEVVVSKARDYGKTKIELEVRNDNPAAIRIYEKVGFEVEGIRKHGFYADGKYIDLILMGRNL